jgi:hypothetical protein
MRYSVNQEFPWRKLYEAAILELDRIKLQERVDTAYAALRQRTEELMMGDHPGTGSLEERQALADALHSLRSLEKLELRPADDFGPRGTQACGEAS